MNKTINEHYVPQSYLRRFLGSENTIFVYDKPNDSIFESGTLPIAQERYFFDLPNEVVGNKDPQELEHIFSEMELEYNSLLNEILNTIDRKRRFNPKHKTMMALFIAIQFLRTNEYRKGQAQHRKELLKVINKDLAKQNLKMRFGYKEEAANHLLFLFDPKMLDIVIRKLLEGVWVVWDNKTRHPFYTSDNPVVIDSKIVDHPGFGSPGAEINLPINSKFLLSICDRQFFLSLIKSDCKVINLEDVDRIEHFNKLQVLHSTRQIYCSAKKFDLAKEMCKLNPDLRNPDRPRVKVEEIGDLTRFTPK